MGPLLRSSACLASNASFDAFQLGCWWVRLGPERGLFWDGSYVITRVMVLSIQILEVIWQSFSLIVREGTACAAAPQQSGPELRSSLRILGLEALCVPPWDTARTVAFCGENRKKICFC